MVEYVAAESLAPGFLLFGREVQSQTHRYCNHRAVFLQHLGTRHQPEPSLSRLGYSAHRMCATSDVHAAPAASRTRLLWRHLAPDLWDADQLTSRLSWSALL